MLFVMSGVVASLLLFILRYFFLHLVLFLFFLCHIALFFFSHIALVLLGVICSLLVSCIIHHLSWLHGLHDVKVSVAFFWVNANLHSILVSCCLLCLGLLLSFFSAALCMIACHCRFSSLWAWCCHYYEFVVPSSFCHLHFIAGFVVLFPFVLVCS